ncbi:hypothetical protein [Nostoc sp.]|uniref:hypothetical protein n=1 Tax=Nostoc sp. TaxID=1180 RepID=UPI002FF5ED63
MDLHRCILTLLQFLALQRKRDDLATYIIPPLVLVIYEGVVISEFFKDFAWPVQTDNAIV